MQDNNNGYALITAAKNEEAYIRQVLQSVVEQTRVPRLWAIVSDGSTDRTDEFVTDFARRYDFIRLIRLANEGSRAFSSQAFASNAGYETIKHTEFDFVGFLDADISLEASYYETVLDRLKANPKLGIAGGQILEPRDGRFNERFGNSEDCVAGAIQLFRRKCYEDVGGLIPLHYGGHDSVANAMARRKGWEVRSFSDLRVFHHRPTGTAGSTVWRARFRDGMADYFMGYDALFEIGKCLRRVTERPFCLGSVLRLSGYVFPGFTGQKPMVSDDFVRYLRHEQMGRVLHSVFGR
jgi:glycosyltransferase involved in cell wall biosynthesis